jgi:hypothetical protein
MSYSSALSPMTLADILDAAFRLYRALFFRLIGTALLFQGVIGVLLLSVVSQADPTLLTVNIDSYEEGEDRYDDLPTLITPLFSHSIADDWLIRYYDATSFIYSLTFGAAVVSNLTLGLLSAMLARRYLGPAAVWPQQAGLSMRGMIALACVALLSLICGDPLFLGWNYVRYLRSDYLKALQPLSTFALVWPAIVLVMLASAIMPQIVVLERRGPLSGLWRSVQFARRAPWRTLALLVLSRVCLSLLIFSAILLMLPVANSSLKVDGATIFFAMSCLLATVFVLPFQAAIFTVLYIDLRNQVEGADLDLRLRQAF